MVCVNLLCKVLNSEVLHIMLLPTVVLDVQLFRLNINSHWQKFHCDCDTKGGHVLIMLSTLYLPLRQLQ